MGETAAGPQTPVTEQTASFFAKIARGMLIALAGALLGGIVTYFKDELQAHAERLIFKGKLDGDYVLKTFAYDDKTRNWTPYTMTFGLSHAGTHVFGTIRSTTSDRAWEAYGYFRDPVLALSYENTDSAAVGTGAYVLKQDVPYVMWGHWIGVECDDNTNQRLVAQCPAIMYRSDSAKEEKRYTEFMSRTCVTITPDSGPCPAKKTSDKAKLKLGQ